MKKRISILIAVIAVLTACVLLTSCGGKGAPPYEGYEKDGFNVSIRYDANGGLFATNTSVIVDTYNVSNYTVDSEGMAGIKLIAPDDTVRQQPNYFTASKSKYFLAGWYTERVAHTDAEGNELDVNGNIAKISGEPVAYDYSGRWDFKNGRLKVDPNKDYSATVPVITLYAAWIPEFSYEFYDLDTGELLSSYAFDPMYTKDIDVPVWDTTTGALKLNKFPDVKDKTFNNVYLDPAAENLVTDKKIVHTGVVDLSTATATGNVMKLYLDMLDGKWINVYTADQFLNNVTLSGNYNICQDLDFAGKSWSTLLMHGDFVGTINGNGYSFKNISATQTDTNQFNTGLFGNLTAEAEITDLSLENVSFTIGVGSRRQGASFGLFAGTIHSDATLEGVTVSGKLSVTPSSLITSATTIGLLCGMGEVGEIDISSISAEALLPTDEYTDPIELDIDGNTVTVIIKQS